MSEDLVQFQKDRSRFIEEQGKHTSLMDQSVRWMQQTIPLKYSYNFDWLGLPIIQYPQDMVAIQEIIWKTKPNWIIETGIARGGSLILSASILQLLNARGKVVGIDIDIRPHNRKAIEEHPLFFRIKLLEGSSIDSEIIQQVKNLIAPEDTVMVILDSNHTHQHVFQELMLYSPLVTKNSYLIVMDTVIADIPECTVPNRDWNQSNNPKTAVRDFLQKNDRFEIDFDIQNKLLITVAPNGYLKCKY